MSAPSSAEQKQKEQADARAKVAAWLEQAKKGGAGGADAQKPDEKKPEEQKPQPGAKPPQRGRGGARHHKRAHPYRKSRNWRADSDDENGSESDQPDAPARAASRAHVPAGAESGSESDAYSGSDEDAPPARRPSARSARGRQHRAPAPRAPPRPRVPLSEMVRAEVQRHHLELKEAEERARLAAQGERSSAALGALQFFAR